MRNFEILKKSNFLSIEWVWFNILIFEINILHWILSRNSNLGQTFLNQIDIVLNKKHQKQNSKFDLKIFDSIFEFLVKFQSKKCILKHKNIKLAWIKWWTQ